MILTCGMDKEVDRCINKLDGEKWDKKEFLVNLGFDGLTLFGWILKKAVERP